MSVEHVNSISVDIEIVRAIVVKHAMEGGSDEDRMDAQKLVAAALRLLEGALRDLNRLADAQQSIVR